MKKIISMMIMILAILNVGSYSGAAQDDLPSSPVGHFKLIATYQASGNVAEIAAATADGQTLIVAQAGM